MTTLKIAESKIKGQYYVQLWIMSNARYQVNYGKQVKMFNLFDDAIKEFSDCVRHAYACYEASHE